MGRWSSPLVFFASRSRHTRFDCDWSSDVCSSDLVDQPLYPLFFIDNDLTNGKGFEGSLAYAIGERLGFTKDQIKWGYTSFNSSYAPGPKPFDFYMTEVSITDDRAKAVDFSDPYYNSPLVVVTKKGSPVLQA